MPLISHVIKIYWRPGVQKVTYFLFKNSYLLRLLISSIKNLQQKQACSKNNHSFHKAHIYTNCQNKNQLAASAIEILQTRLAKVQLAANKNKIRLRPTINCKLLFTPSCTMGIIFFCGAIDCLKLGR